MKYNSLTITPSGCVLPVYEKDRELIGALPIETGDFKTAEKILTPEAYDTVLLEWTPERIAKRKAELEQQEQMQAKILFK